jgi:hypothetical protein
VRRAKKGQFVVIAALGMAIMMVSFATTLAEYSVSPINFAKSNIREIQIQSISNFRRALAIGLAEVSQQLEFKSRVRQYSTYLDLSSYPSAKTLGYEIISNWQNLTLISYPGAGLNLTTTPTVFICSWNSTSGISYAASDITLDILNSGFYGFKESTVASLNLTLLEANQTGSDTRFYFSLKAENDRSLPDLTESSIQILYQKQNGAWNTSNPASTSLFYLGQGSYMARFLGEEMASPVHIRLIVKDSRGIIVGARNTPATIADIWGPSVSGITLTPNPSRGVNQITLRATISDAYRGWSTVRAANYTIRNSNGNIVRQGSMNPLDGSFNSVTEQATATIDVTGLATGSYTVYIQGRDSLGNLGDIASTTLSITPALKIHVESIDMSVRRSGGSGWYEALAVIKILDENGQPINDATVRIRWTGSVSGTSSQRTDQNGIVSFTSPRARRGSSPLTFTIAVTDVTAVGYVYYPAANKETTDTIRSS